MLNLKRLAAATAISLASLSLAYAETPKDTLVVGWWIDDVITLDPAEILEISTTEVLSNSYERLINYDPKDASKLYGVVAESWTISPDGKTFTFKIRQGKKFASGNPLTAEDVAFTLQRVVALDKAPAFIITQLGLNKDNFKDRIRQTGPFELTFETDKAYAPTFVLNCLSAATSSVVDKKLVMANEKDGDYGYNWLKTNYAGSGPFKIMTWKANEAILMERNDNYPVKAPMKKVYYLHIKEISKQRLMLEKGDIDIARKLDADQIAALEKNPNITITEGPKSTVFYLGLNQKNQYLAKPEVKDALKYLVDYDTLTNTIVKRIGKTHQTFLPEGMMGADNATPFKLDPDKAKALLEKAGLKDGFSVTMDTRNSSIMMAVGQSLQLSFAKAGVKLELIPGDGRQTLTKYRGRQHDIYIGQWGADYQDPNTNASVFALNKDNSDDAKSKPLAWRNAWAVPAEINAMTEAAVLEPDAAKRIAIYKDLQRKVMEQGPYVIMYQDIETWVARKNVKGFIVGPSSDTNYVNQVTKD